MSSTTFAGPVTSTAGFVGALTGNVTGNLTGNVTGNVTGSIGTGAQGAANTYNQVFGQKTAIVDATATTLFTITVPNAAHSAGGRILCTSGITLAAHLDDSTRTIEYIFSVTRVPGAAAVMTISIITGGTVIATSSGGLTLTSTLAAGAVGGGVTVANTFAIQITNTGSGSAPSTTATWMCEYLNQNATGITIAAA